MNQTHNNLSHFPEYRKLSVCITFHYVENRLKYLKEVCNSLIDIAPEIFLTIITNTDEADEIKEIKNTVDTLKLKLDLVIPVGLGHPYLLAWSHLPVFKKQFEDESFTHFLYVEDDIKITKENLDYWLERRAVLIDSGFIPGFLRVEKNDLDGNLYSTDVMERMSMYDCPTFDVENKGSFISIVYPYQGIYFLDRELMYEHLNGPSSNPDFEHNNVGLFRVNGPQIREKAALALTYVNVPEGFRSRNLLPYDEKTRQIDPRSFVHHLPNNYTNDPSHKIGKLQINDLFIPMSINTYLRKKIKTGLASLLSNVISLKF
jgi:hypothetical protein